MASKFLLAGCTLVAADWVFSKSGDMCAGIQSTCDSMESCTEVAYGPCNGAASFPDSYLKSHIVGAAIVMDDTKYLNCDDPTVCDHMQVTPFTGNGYRDFESADMFAYTMTGAITGDLATSGAYIGTASYLAKKDITTQYNDFYVAAYDTLEPVQRNSSSKGAPVGPYHVCISENTKGTCGDARTWEAGTYKFSIFGYTSGPQFEMPAGAKYYGVRAKLTAVNIPVTGVYLNGNTALLDIDHTDVTRLNINYADKSIQIDFPSKYNFGPIPSQTGIEYTPATSSKDVKIKVSPAGSDSIYIDYLFEATDLSATGKMFVYDPPVHVGQPAVAVAAPTRAGGDAAAPTRASGFSGAGALSSGLMPAAVAVVAAGLTL